MQTQNPYQPPQTDSELSEPEWPEISVDGLSLVVASGVALPRRCIKTNQPATEDDAVQRTLQWRGQTLQLIVNVPECQIRWYASAGIRRRAMISMALGWLMFFGSSVVVLASVDQDWIPMVPAIPISFAVGVIGFFVTRLDYGLQVVDYQHHRFWLKGCCPEFLDALKQELAGKTID